MIIDKELCFGTGDEGRAGSFQEFRESIGKFEDSFDEPTFRGIPIKIENPLRCDHIPIAEGRTLEDWGAIASRKARAPRLADMMKYANDAGEHLQGLLAQSNDLLADIPWKPSSMPMGVRVRMDWV